MRFALIFLRGGMGLIVAFILASCNGLSNPTALAETNVSGIHTIKAAVQQTAPTPTTLTGLILTLAPIVTATQPQPTSTAVPTAAPAPCQQIDGQSATHYDVLAQVSTQAKTVGATMHAFFTNTGALPLDKLVMNVDANRTAGSFTLNGLRGEGSTAVASSALTGPRLEIALSTPLQPNCTADVFLDFKVAVAALDDARMVYLSYTDRQLNLGHWLPQFAPYVPLRQEWLLPKSWVIGEYTLADMGDYQVTVNVTDADNVEVIGPGNFQRIDPHTWQFSLTQARSFTLCITNAMSKLSAQTADGLLIDLYYFTVREPTEQSTPDGVDAPHHALEVARQAMGYFQQIYGKLPYHRLVIVEGDFPDGMEFSALVYVSHKWFKDYKGKVDSWLTLITAHEVSHQWWYSMVANDQGIEPYLDESLSLYSELLYLEKYQPTLVPWWWTFRIKLYQPQGYVDAQVYEFGSVRLYINAVYLRGAQMLQEIREMIGTDEFFAWLQQYYALYTDKIVTSQQFWAALPAGDYERLAAIRAKYLRNTDPLNVQSSFTPNAVIKPEHTPTATTTTS